MIVANFRFIVGDGALFVCAGAGVEAGVVDAAQALKTNIVAINRLKTIKQLFFIISSSRFNGLRLVL